VWAATCRETAINFFKLYIGDYQRDTAHLTVTEHGAYLLMLQHYYATEKPLPVGKALHRMLRAQEKAERDAIDQVAKLFWKQTDAGLVNERANEEIAKASTQAEVNARIAREREAKRKGPRNPHDPPHEPSTNRATNDQPNHSHSHSQTPEEIALAISARERLGEALESGGITPECFNLDDPRLLALVEQGATPDEFKGLAKEAVDKGIGSPFAWVLTVLPDRRAKAASLVLAPKVEPPPEVDRTAETQRILAEQEAHKKQSVPPPPAVLELARRMKAGV